MNEIAPMTPTGIEHGDFAMSDGVEKLFAALAKAQASDLSAAFNATNPAFKSKYANLAAIWDAVRSAFPAHGLCVVQFPSARDRTVSVRTMIGHESGQWVANTLTAVAKDAMPQSVGSTVTYLRRFGLASMAGVIAEPDDDGNEASGRGDGGRQAAPAANSMREHAQSLPPRQTAAPAGERFALVGPDGQELSAVAKDGKPAQAIWLAWFRAALQRIKDADTLRSWFQANEDHIGAVEKAHPGAEQAVREAYTARFAELDDSFPTDRKPAMAGGK